MAAFTLVHVLLSLIAIGAGSLVVTGFLHANEGDTATKIFLTSALLTSITGFLFPFHGFTPATGVGIVSLSLLAVAIYGRYNRRLAGSWRRTYVILAVTALYLNVFVLVVQLFEKVPPLRALAPTQTEAPFAAAQVAVLAIFISLGIQAARKFQAARRPAVRAATGMR